jgi:hypothetical protein
MVRTAHPSSRHGQANAAAGRVGPSQQIRKQYARFYSNFQAVETSYVEALSQQSSGTVTATTTLTAPYASGSVSMQVADAGVFGPAGIYTSPVTATALVGSVPVGTYTIKGSSANLLAINTALSSQVSLGTSTTLTAQVTSSASTSAATIFPSYITTSTQQLAVNLVAYFNSLPIRLPRFYALPHYPQRAGAIQQYVYELVAGAASTSLKNTLTAVALPLTPGSDLQIYDATVKTAIDASESQMLSGVQQIFAEKLQVVVPGTPGLLSLLSSSSSSGTGSTSTGSTSTGAA